MNCDHCGKPVNLNAKFCGKCGAFLNFAKKIQAESDAVTAFINENNSDAASVSVTSTLSQSEHTLEQHVLVEASENNASKEVEAVYEHNQDQGLPEILVAHQDSIDSLPDHVVHEELVNAGKQETVAQIHEEVHEVHEVVSEVTQHVIEAKPEHLPEPEPEKVSKLHEGEHSVEVVEALPANLEHAVHNTISQSHIGEKAVEEVVNIEQLAPILNNSIPILTAEFGASLDSLRIAIDAMRTEMDAIVVNIKGDVHSTAQALAQKIQASQGDSAKVDMQGFNSSIEQLRAEIALHFGEMKEIWVTSAQSLVNKNSDDIQTILSAEFKKIQTGIVNLYNTQQNNVVKSTSAFDEVVAGLTFKIQNIENFVNSQLANQAQAQSAAQTANRSLVTAVNEIKTQLQAQQELLSGLTIDPALIKTMNSFNINFRKQQEQMAAAKAQPQTPVKTKSNDSSSVSDTVVMWFVGFLCGLTILLGGFSVYNYYSAQEVKAELHKKKIEDALKSKDKADQDDHVEKDLKKSETEEGSKGSSKEDSKSASDPEAVSKGQEVEKERADKSDKVVKSSESSKEKSTTKAGEREKGDEKQSDKSSSKKHVNPEKE